MHLKDYFPVLISGHQDPMNLSNHTSFQMSPNVLVCLFSCPALSCLYTDHIKISKFTCLCWAENTSFWKWRTKPTKAIPKPKWLHPNMKYTAQKCMYLYKVYRFVWCTNLYNDQMYRFVWDNASIHLCNHSVHMGAFCFFFLISNKLLIICIRTCQFCFTGSLLITSSLCLVIT